MTVKDIAQLAGVSAATVSRVINDRETKAASKETREKIWEIIRQTGYTPDTSARNLRAKADADKEKTVTAKYYACVFARSNDKNHMFFSELSKAIESEAYKKGYLLKCTYYADELYHKSFASDLKAQNIHGIAVLGRFENPKVLKVFESLKNVVYVGLVPLESRHDVVFCDGYLAGKLAMNSLISFHHKLIAYIGSTTGQYRYKSYCDVLTENRISINRELIVSTKQTIEGGYLGAQVLLSRNVQFSAIFCASDAVAMGCIKYLHEKRIIVPDNISIISVDDVEASRYFIPMLTTVHIPIDELGKQTAKILIDRIEKGHTLPVKLELPFSLSQRDTCMERRKQADCSALNKK